MAEKKGFFAEFKEFCMKGNILDIAVGMVIATAFTAIVNSLVNDLIMPLVGLVCGKVDFSALSFTVGSATVTYGAFIQAVVDFVLIAFAVFIFVKVVTNAQKKLHLKEEVVEEEVEETPADIQLLEEIRDLLKEKK